MKKSKFFLWGGLLVAVSLLGGGILGVWLGQDRIISLFVQEANRHLRTPVRVGHLEVSVWQAFPRVAITLHDVVVMGSLPGDTAALARVKSLYCAFDAWDMLAGRYHIRALTLADGRVQVRHDARGRPNYAIFRADSTQAADKPLAFELETIRLERVGVQYANDSQRQRYALRAHDLRASLTVTDASIRIRAAGNMRVETVRLGTDDYFRGKDLALTTQLVIDRQAQQLTIQPSVLRVGQASYDLAGRMGYGGAATDWDLTLNGQHTNLQALTALLPPRLTQRLNRYRSRGDMYFRGRVQTVAAGTNPRIDIRFGCRDASFYHPEYQETVEHVFLRGAFSNGAQRTARTTSLTLQNLRGMLRGRPFSGNLRYENLLDPSVRLDLRADVDVARVLRFFPVAAVRGASGQAQLAVRLAGNLRQFRARPATAVRQSGGELTLRGVNVQLRDYAQPLTGLSGNFLLRGNDVAITDFTGHMGHSDFRLNGFFKNALGWLLLPHQQLLVEADVTARRLDLDELLRMPTRGRGRAVAAATEDAGGAGYALEVSPNLALELRATVGQVRFRRFRGRALHGTVRLQNQVLSTPGLSVAAAGGSATLRGQLDARQPDLLKASTHMTCTQLPLDSLFYVFEDFGQQFLTARHLRGTLTATAESDIYFDRNLRPLTDRLEAEVQATVRNGELNNFAPLQKLSMVASREQLRHLRFAQLTNSLYIQSRTVYVPEMEIRSNVRAAAVLRVTGTHTFDQQMDYHLSIPILPGLLRRVSLGGETATGPTLLLAVQGNETDFRVSLDRSRGQAGRPPAPARRVPGPVPGPATGPAASGPEAAPVVAPKLFELKKPEKKPAQPQPDQYFDF
ncbi:AsmA-like C-terminal region-containing protein [Hymenobacter daecheongensis]|uniref:AsmA-like C-terminal region-containing protein n=1 Tax=Hymenobacter daecheongensis TaxID=496053 RepID=UPI000934BE68|nr:AsmA-like C-terminal region-containing protein [Hymenobacter daecheongensis]